MASQGYQTTRAQAYISPSPVLSPETIVECAGAERKRWGDLICKLNIQMEG